MTVLVTNAYAVERACQWVKGVIPFLSWNHDSALRAGCFTESKHTELQQSENFFSINNVAIYIYFSRSLAKSSNWKSCSCKDFQIVFFSFLRTRTETYSLQIPNYLPAGIWLPETMRTNPLHLSLQRDAVHNHLGHNIHLEHGVSERLHQVFYWMCPLHS